MLSKKSPILRKKKKQSSRTEFRTLLEKEEQCIQKQNRLQPVWTFATVMIKDLCFVFRQSPKFSHFLLWATNECESHKKCLRYDGDSSVGTQNLWHICQLIKLTQHKSARTNENKVKPNTAQNP